MYEYEGSVSGTANSGSLLPTLGNGNNPTEPLRFCLVPSKSAAK